MATAALNKLAQGAVAIGAGVSFLQASMYNVDGGFRAVMFDRIRGVQRYVTGEGTHFRIPWLQTPHIFDVRIRPRNISSNTGTKDLQVGARGEHPAPHASSPPCSLPHPHPRPRPHRRW